MNEQQPEKQSETKDKKKFDTLLFWAKVAAFFASVNTALFLINITEDIAFYAALAMGLLAAYIFYIIIIQIKKHFE